MGTWNCHRCGNCCRWPGIVKIDDQDVARIAEFLGITETEFVAAYTDIRPDRKGLTLISRDDDSCIFLEGRNHCSIQSVKPRQCSDFLVRWFPRPEDNCQASFVED